MAFREHSVIPFQCTFGQSQPRDISGCWAEAQFMPAGDVLNGTQDRQWLCPCGRQTALPEPGQGTGAL